MTDPGSASWPPMEENSSARSAPTSWISPVTTTSPKNRPAVGPIPVTPAPVVFDTATAPTTPLALGTSV